MKRKGKKFLIALLSFCMVLTMMPLGVWATGGEDGSGAVARIGEMEYATLDDAVKAAVAAADDEVTIELLKDCTTEGLNLSKSITIKKASDLEKKTDGYFYKVRYRSLGQSSHFQGLRCDNERNRFHSLYCRMALDVHLCK